MHKTTNVEQNKMENPSTEQIKTEQNSTELNNPEQNNTNQSKLERLEQNSKELQKLEQDAIKPVDTEFLPDDVIKQKYLNPSVKVDTADVFSLLLNGYSYDEISSITGIKSSAVIMRITSNINKPEYAQIMASAIALDGIEAHRQAKAVVSKIVDDPETSLIDKNRALKVFQQERQIIGDRMDNVAKLVKPVEMSDVARPSFTYNFVAITNNEAQPKDLNKGKVIEVEGDEREDKKQKI